MDRILRNSEKLGEVLHAYMASNGSELISHCLLHINVVRI